MSFDKYSQLKILQDFAFPKKCPCCGKVYLTATDFFEQTFPLRASHSGLMEVEGDRGLQVVDAFRNCVCGTTMMEEFYCRRDQTAEGLLRRRIFKK